MRLLVLALCVLFLNLPAYGQKELKADLLSHASESVVMHHMLALAEKTHEPSDLRVGVFAGHLMRALSGKTLHEGDVTSLVTEVDAVFKSAGTSTIGYLDHIDRFKAAVAAAGVPRLDSDSLGRELDAIGKQVRGPDDTPVQFAPARQIR